MGDAAQNIQWGKVIDQNRCIGCHACTVACKQEHSVPLGVTRTYVKQVEVGAFPNAQRQFQVTRCNQCNDPPCVAACPTTAMFRRPDGIVDFDRDRCIGCKACISACPYDAIYIDPESHTAEKCNFCTHRIDIGLEPACVVVCPTQAILVGDMNDAESRVSKILDSQNVEVRRPEKQTDPKLFYLGAGQQTLDPQSASNLRGTPVADSQSWPQSQFSALYGASELNASDKNRSRDPDQSAAAAILVYDQPHRTPWDWRVSSYSWTKSIAAGVFIMTAVLGLLGVSLSQSWEVITAVLSAVFLGATGLLLVADLDQPMRFYYVLTKPQWRSWLVRGAYLMSAFVLVLLLFFLAALFEWQGLVQLLRWVGTVVAVAVAVYTAFLLSRSKGRDLWQNPLLVLVFLSHAVVAGSASLLILGIFVELEAGGITRLQMSLLISLAVFLGLALSELLDLHPTPHATAAARNMWRGRYRLYYWAGILLGGIIPLTLTAIALTNAPDWTYIAASASALTGLLAYEHAYIQAGQSVPQS